MSGPGKGHPETIVLNPGTGALPFAQNLSTGYEVQRQLETLYRQIQAGGGGLNLWNKGFWVEKFAYDPNGNVINKKNGWGEITYQYNESNQLIQAGNRTYQYDLNGNLSREELGSYYVNYEYNPENRLIRAVNNSPLIYPDRDFNGETRYGYDALATDSCWRPRLWTNRTNLLRLA